MASERNERLRTHSRLKERFFLWLSLAFVTFLSVPTRSNATELKAQTLAAWDEYVGSACQRIEMQENESSFLRLDEVPEDRVRVRAGQTLVWRHRDGHPAAVRDGLIHDWMGAVFIPNATIEDVIAVVRDYDRYPQIYGPAVLKATKLGSAGNDDDFSMLLMQKVLFVTAALQGEYETRYIQVDAKHWYSISHSTSLQAIENFGQPNMRVLLPDRGPGYVWRLYSFAKFEESDGGVYVELEALGLSRNVPALLRWLVGPIVERLPRNSMQATLEQTRKAVLTRIRRED